MSERRLRTIEQAKAKREQDKEASRQAREATELAEKPKRDALAKFKAQQASAAAQFNHSSANYLPQARLVFDYFVSKIEADSGKDRDKILTEMRYTNQFDSVTMLEEDYDEAIAPMTSDAVFDWQREAFPLTVRVGPKPTYHDGQQWVPLPEGLYWQETWRKYSDHGLLVDLPNWERLAKAFRKRPLRQVIRAGYFKGWTLKTVCGRGWLLWFDASLAMIVLEKPLETSRRCPQCANPDVFTALGVGCGAHDVGRRATNEDNDND